jgi:hypothetical protein
VQSDWSNAHHILERSVPRQYHVHHVIITICVPES